MYSYISKINKLHKTKTKAALTIGHKDKSSKNSSIVSFDELERFTRVSTVSRDAFNNCTALVRVSLPKNLSELGGDSTLRTGAFMGCTALVYVTFNDSLTKLGAYAFYQCSSLGDIILPDGVTVIDVRTFEDSGLKSIILGNAVTEIKSFAFQNCSSLVSVNIPDTIKKINTQAFYKCTSLVIDDLNLPYLTEIGDKAFGYTKVKKVSNLGSVTTVQGFANCTELTEFTFPDTCTTLPNNAFKGCTSLVIDDLNLLNLETFGQYALAGVSVKKISSLGKVTSLPAANYSVENYGRKDVLEEVIITSNVATIPQYSFSGYTALKKVDIDVQKTDTYSFEGCTSLERVIIGDSINMIVGASFRRCTALKSVIIKATTPPTLENVSAFTSTNNCPIYVPDSSVSAYQEATNWNALSARIKPLSELV